MLNDSESRFLLVFLSIQTILQETTIYSRRQRLGAMKNGLDLGGAYGTTLRRIKAQGGEKARLGMAVLMWISHSRRPLQVDELCHAIAIRIGSIDLNSDGIPAISTVLSCCQGLVTMGKGGSTVRFIHFTLQEYLCAGPDLFDRAHATMAETCLTYLNFQRTKDLSASPPPDLRGTPFLEYSSLYWGTHMRIELSDRAKTFALQLLDQFDSHISTKFLWDSMHGELSIQGFHWRPIPDRKGFSALHCISYFGIAEVAAILIKMNRWDVSQKDGAGMTPLIRAARYGHEEVVRLLLRNRHIQPDQQDSSSGRTALSWAAGSGHEGTVRLFLGPRFVNPGSIGREWGKAARVVNTLFGGRYVNPNSTCNYGRTPLLWATQNGYEGIVKLLLGRKDINPNSSCQFGRTPLLWAVQNGNEGIAKLLLGREDINPDIPDKTYGQTLLWWAVENGREGTVKLLLERKDVNPNSSYQSAQVPPSLAAGGGHEEMAGLLLGRWDVNPNTPDKKYCQTPLLWAAMNSHEGIVKLLLERKDVNPDIPDKAFGLTPLSWATQNGHEGVVKLLLERKDVNPNIPDTRYGWTPLSSAAMNSHEGIVKLLLERKDVNPNIPDKHGWTPLSSAAMNGHEGIVKLLLERKDVNPNIPDKYGQTALTLATRSRRDAVVELLQAPRSQPIP